MARPVERRDVLLGDERVAELVLLVAELDDRTRQRRAFLDAQLLGQRAGRHISADHFQGNDLDLADQLLAHVDSFQEVGRDADAVQLHHHEFADAVVEHALAIQYGTLFVVERGGVVLEVLDQGARLRPLVQDLRLALIDLAALGHVASPGPEGMPALATRTGKAFLAHPGMDVASGIVAGVFLALPRDYIAV